MELKPLADVTFGAHVANAQIGALAEGDWPLVEAGLAEFGLLHFHGQRFDARAVATFGKRFGALEGDLAEARGISNKREDAAPLSDRDPAWLTRAYPTRFWHADGTFNEVAPRVCILAGAAIPLSLIHI